MYDWLFLEVERAGRYIFTAGDPEAERAGQYIWVGVGLNIMPQHVEREQTFRIKQICISQLVLYTYIDCPL